MSQISPPFRIALVAMLAVCAVWFTVLRPKSPAADAPLPAAPGTTGLANDVAAAKGAATASDAANARVQDATGGSTAKSAPKPATTAAAKAAAKAAPKGATKSSKATPTDRHAAGAGKTGGAEAPPAGPHAPVAGKTAPAAAAKRAATGATSTATATAKAAPAAKPAADAAPAANPTAKAAPAASAKTATDPSAPLLRALDRNRAVVLLFWNRRGSDDRAARQAAQSVDRHHGRVVVKVVPVASVGRYTAITKGVQILEAPTVLVIAPGGKARAIAGLTSTPELNQAVADVLAGVKSGK